MTDVIESHYRRLAAQYDDFLRYSPDFVRRHARHMVAMLRLKEDDRLVDLGCGTAMYSLGVRELVPLRHPITCVDPFQEMLDGIPEDAPVVRVPADALAFARGEGPLGKVLMKEAIHHVEDRPALFGALRRRMRPGGRVLLAHVPPRVEYPLFEAALERCLAWHADPDELAAQLGTAGFGVERDVLVVRHRIPKEVYFGMVEGRYMSVLSSFDDDELRAGLEEMERRWSGHDVLEFDDRFDYIAGERR